MTFRFDLTSEQFLPCVHRDGTPVDLGLRDALVQAHVLAELRDQSPLVTAALHRLLLAILHRAYDGPRTKPDRAVIRNAKSFDPATVGGYLDRWRDRFDLFHEKHPFYQTAGFAQADDKRSGVNRLAQELARGNNTALFDHTADDPPPAFTPDQAARAVVTEQMFAVSAGRGKKGEPHTTDSPACRCAVVLARGDTLFETLWLNLTVYNPTTRAPVPSLPEDRPVWEWDEPRRADRDAPTPAGYLDYLTWQSRVLRLHPESAAPDGNVVVRRVSYAQGRRFDRPEGFFDPMAAYRRDKRAGFLEVRIDKDKALWRDSAALFQFADTNKDDKGDQYRGPTVLKSLGELGRDVLPRTHRYRLSAFGLCTDQAKVHLWRHEVLPFPPLYLDHPLRCEALRKAIESAETVARQALKEAVKRAVLQVLTGDQGQAPKRERVDAVVDGLRAEDLYWTLLERPFRRLLTDIGETASEELEDALDRHVYEWYRDTLYRAAREAYERTVGRLNSARELRAVARGRDVLSPAGRDVLSVRLRVLAVRERLLDSRTEAAT